MKNNHSLPNFYSITPSYIRYDRDLSNFDKVLYGEISSLTNQKGYCFAYNKYFEIAYNVTDRTVQRALKRLETKGYIFVDIERNELTNQVLERKIYLILKDNQIINTPIDKNDTTPIDKNDTITRVNALNLKNNTSVNNNYNNRSSFSSKNKPKDIQVDWLEDYIKNMD